jgi:hypothetical protein
MASCRTLALVLPFLLAAPAHGFLGNGLALRSSATQMFSSQSAAAGLVRRSAEHLARRPARTAPLQMMAEEDPVVQPNSKQLDFRAYHCDQMICALRSFASLAQLSHSSHPAPFFSLRACGQSSSARRSS